MRRVPSVLAVAAVVAVVAAAALDSLRGGDGPRATVPAPPPPCREDQLALDLATREERPVIRLRHVRGPRCTAPDYAVGVEVAGGEALVQEGSTAGLFAPGVEWERTFRFQPRCDQRGPFTATVRIGPYTARGIVSAMPCFRTEPELAAFYRECARSWNRSVWRAREAGRFDIAVLFRSSDGFGAERCGLQLRSSVTARELILSRASGRPWTLERARPVEFHDAQPVELRPDGRLGLG